MPAVARLGYEACMSNDPERADGADPAPGISRRRLLTSSAASAVLGGVGVGGAALVWSHHSHPQGPAVWYQPDRNGAPPVVGVHLQFGENAGTEVVVSWHTTDAVRNPRVMLGTPTSGFGRTVAAETRTYRDGKSNLEVRVNHARLTNLTPDTDYVYAAVHDGAEPETGTVRTAPVGRKPLRFTSFGDQSTPTLGKLPNGSYGTDNIGSPAAADTTLAIERLGPLFNLVNGDLCYANLAQDRIRTWSDWFENNTRSARYRPWMPAAGQTAVTRGLWYAFTAGAMRVISIANDDVCYQDGGNSYVRGYSAGAQKAWLEQELAAARRAPHIDWVVVCMHQVAISTADMFNGADLGIREEWVPLFDKYGVDLVVCGHEHHYERSHPIRGHESNPTLTPVPAATATDVIDTTQGTVHMVIGGGGTSIPSNQLFFNPPACRVITAVGEQPDPKTGKRAPVYIKEHAPWSAVRNAAHAYGFAAFTLDPGSVRGGTTSIKVVYYDVVGPDGQLAAFESFTLRRPRRD